MIENRLLVIRDTFLSRRPARHSFTVGMLSLACLTVVSTLYWSDQSALSGKLEAIPSAIFQHHQYWRLLTALFVHADVRHLLSNVFVFGFLAYLLYGYYGSIIYPGLMFALGMLTNLISVYSYPPDVRLVGASGMIYAMSGFWLLLYLFIERRLSVAKRLLRSLGFAMITLLPASIDPGVSYRTHAIGFVLGSISAIVYFLVKKSTFRMTEVFEFDD